MAFPSVSFICTFYNKAAYVRTVLNSIKSQRHLEQVEYIFVDDGSTDNTLELLHKFTAGWDNCRIITQKNGGQTVATITALKLAQHEFVKSWDGDDYAHPELTAKLIRACEKFNVNFAYCDVNGGPDIDPDSYEFLRDWMETRPIAEANLQKSFLKHVLHTPITNPTGSVFRRSFFLAKMKLPDPRVVIPDVYMSYCAALSTDLAYVPAVMAFAFPNVPNRLTSNKAQIMHDLNAALACFYDNFYDDLSYGVKLFIGRRAAGRARLWARRNHKQRLFTSLYGRLGLRSFIPVPMDKKDVFKTCGAFKQGNAKIRTGVGMIED